MINELIELPGEPTLDQKIAQSKIKIHIEYAVEMDATRVTILAKYKRDRTSPPERFYLGPNGWVQIEEGFGTQALIVADGDIGDRLEIAGSFAHRQNVELAQARAEHLADLRAMIPLMAGRHA